MTARDEEGRDEETGAERDTEETAETREAPELIAETAATEERSTGSAPPPRSPPSTQP